MLSRRLCTPGGVVVASCPGTQAIIPRRPADDRPNTLARLPLNGFTAEAHPSISSQQSHLAKRGGPRSPHYHKSTYIGLQQVSNLLRY
ncbi:uncharacterized protein CC84DRAFT_1167891 [Paraphaeosphaeria sporulosa]|uniref:Uncharacterized protein n=1 Tax=Paraphaeosphaeria sporulosa TaxID=1460663 RepID=A0A177C4B5_9PLEO|nr:uncharacterized protein CC84DRAFT_1167891 [Paraphaeosphaeria sporulosa]OAG01729.1 hypothetical protein CC84DRAFT_1167891 [Paraphaeosphaeria sporulosa]